LKVRNLELIFLKIQATLSYHTHKLIHFAWLDTSIILRPTNFKDIFSSKITSFQNYEQHDSQEALLCILDTLHTELSEAKILEYNFCSPTYIELFEEYDEKKISDVEWCELELTYPNIWELFSVKKALDTYNSKSFSIITEIFQNLVSSTLQCPNCKFHNYNFDSCLIISLSIPTPPIDMEDIVLRMRHLGNIPESHSEMLKQFLIDKQLADTKYKCTLEECFENLINVEILDDSNMWYCPRCDDKVNAYKQLYIWK
jgi:ubiquitin carboxyl-terminal hydrolase 8